MEQLSLREALANSIRYWEPRRIIYNLVLACVVIACFVVNLPLSRQLLSLNLALLLFLLVVLANVAYCAAYVVDVFAQLSAVREAWIKYRWALLLIGILFAGVLTRFVCLAMFGVPK